MNFITSFNSTIFSSAEEKKALFPLSLNKDKLIRNMHVIYQRNVDKLNMVNADFCFKPSKSNCDRRCDIEMKLQHLAAFLQQDLMKISQAELSKRLLLEDKYAKKFMKAVLKENLSNENMMKLLSERSEYLLDKSKIVDEKFIPAKTSLGNTALHLAVGANDLLLIDFIKEKTGSHFSTLVNERASNHLSPLELAILTGNFKAAQHLIHLGAIPEPNFWGENIVHLLMKTSVDILKDIIAQPHIQPLLNKADVFGNLPVDIAIAHSNDQAIYLVKGKVDVSSLPNYGQKDVDISQSKIISQLNAYCSLKHGQTSVLDEKGCCQGFSELAFYYFARGKQEEFFKMLKIISTWDGTSESLLKAETNLSTFSGNYANKQELFEQWANDIRWFQHLNLPLDSVLNALMVAEHYDTVKRDDSYLQQILPTLELNSINAHDIENFLKPVTLYPGAAIIFGGGQHATMGWVESNGHIKYYDPNAPHEVMAFDCIEKLAHFIENVKYKMLNKSDNLNATLIMSGYKMVAPSEALTSIWDEESRHAQVCSLLGNFQNTSDSPFFPLHFAILTKDNLWLKSLLAQGNYDVNAPCKVGLSISSISGGPPGVCAKPLFLAIQMPDNAEALDLLLKNKLTTLDGALEFSACSKQSWAVAKLLSQDYVFSDHEMERALSAAIANGDDCTVKILFKHDASFIGKSLALAEKASLEISQLLVSQLKTIDQYDAFGKTFLYYAVAANNKPLVQLLLKEGANPNYPVEIMEYDWQTNTYVKASITPLQWALRAGRDDLEFLLRKE